MNSTDKPAVQDFTFFIMAPDLTPEKLSTVVDFCLSEQLITAGAEPVRLSEQCCKLQLKIDTGNLANVTLQFKQLAQQLQLDLVLLSATEYKQTRKLAVFDMDSTLIKVEVIDELAKRAGVGEQVIAITAAAMRGELDFNQSFEQRLGLLKGLSDNVLADIAAQLPMMEGMQRLIEQLQTLGYKTAILSGGFNYFADYLKAKYKFDYAYSNQLEVLDGKVTGRVVGAIVNGERKVQLLKQIALEEGIDLQQTIAVGDGANDLPMLAAAGLGVAFHAKPLVKEQARHSVSTLGLDGLLYLLAEQA
ncbi:MAG: ACT domain-containing protein/phosphoserine phosphatase SerB [Osedax symbiont Rs2]|nr:MAG: ACT domain-containing protein/phosphoserine phosphatase SerB [Osedax symbiont Rs2]